MFNRVSLPQFKSEPDLQTDMILRPYAVLQFALTDPGLSYPCKIQVQRQSHKLDNNLVYTGCLPLAKHRTNGPTKSSPPILHHLYCSYLAASAIFASTRSIIS